MYTHKYLITLFYVNRQAISKVIVKHRYDLIRSPLITSLRKINYRYRKKYPRYKFIHARTKKWQNFPDS